MFLVVNDNIKEHITCQHLLKKSKRFHPTISRYNSWFCVLSSLLYSLCLQSAIICSYLYFQSSQHMQFNKPYCFLLILVTWDTTSPQICFCFSLHDLKKPHKFRFLNCNLENFILHMFQGWFQDFLGKGASQAEKTDVQS